MVVVVHDLVEEAVGTLPLHWPGAAVCQGAEGHLIEDMVAPLAEGDGGDARALEQVGADLRTCHGAGAAEL